MVSEDFALAHSRVPEVTSIVAITLQRDEYGSVCILG